jgi:hypothetical protein
VRELFTVRRSALDLCAQRLRLIRARGTRSALEKRRTLREQNRLGSLLKKALAERVEKTELRRSQELRAESAWQ